MSLRVLAALLGAVGGLLLAAAGGLAFLAQESQGWHGVLAVVGYAATIAALCAVGYAMVARAPVWLRIIVSIAVPLLAASVWQVVAQTIDDRADSWKGAATTHLLGGVIVLVVALIAFRGQTGHHDEAYTPTHHR